jgi:hypothetical protein
MLRLSLLVSLGLATPLLSATLSLLLVTSGGEPVANIEPLACLLAWGPLLETVLLILAARAVLDVLDQCDTPAGRLRGDRHADTTCGVLVSISFFASHLIQNGPAAAASLPMALLLSAGAVHAARRSFRSTFLLHGPVLFTLHAGYNAAVLYLHGLLGQELP